MRPCLTWLSPQFKSLFHSQSIVRPTAEVKLLFDQNLPHTLRTKILGLSKHEVLTAAFMGWAALKNGDLLRTAEASTNNWPLVKSQITKIFAAIEFATPGSFQVVECGRFSRKH